MDLRTFSELRLDGRRLVVRADLNTPMKDGAVADATRIERFAAGMKPLLQSGARIVVLSHLGRPKGERRSDMSLARVAPALADALGAPVGFLPDCVGETAEKIAALMQPGEVLLCENLRFDPREEANDPNFAAALARLGDVYVNDAFSCAHRAHASTAGIARMMPSVAGPLMLSEIDALTHALERPEAPAVGVIGGAKVSSKIAVLKNLARRLDTLIIGGGMANTFLFADGASMGRSLHEPDHVETVREIRAIAADSGCEILLPTDVVCAYRLETRARRQVTRWDACPDNAMILDVGPASVSAFKSRLVDARTILWNGPLGAFETPPFDHATRVLAEEAAELTRQGLAVTIAGGGDTAAALNGAGVAQDFSYVSTAGGAFLEWLEGRTLPGVAALLTDNIH